MPRIKILNDVEPEVLCQKIEEHLAQGWRIHDWLAPVIVPGGATTWHGSPLYSVVLFHSGAIRQGPTPQEQK